MTPSVPYLTRLPDQTGSVASLILLTWLLFCATGVRAEEDSGGFFEDYFNSLTGEATLSVDSQLNAAEPGIADERATLWFETVLSQYAYIGSAMVFETELAMNLSLPNIQQGNLPGITSINPPIPFFNFRKFVLRWEGESTSAFAGISSINMGFAELYSPVDRFSSYNFGNPRHYHKRGDLLLGISRFINEDEASFTIIPYQLDSIDPPQNSRWLNGSGDRDFFNDAGSANEVRSGASVKEWGYLARYNAVRSGYDFFVAVHTGPSAFPVIKLVPPLVPVTEKRYPLATSLLGGITAIKDNWNFYADVQYQRSRAAVDDSFMRWAVGFSYRDTTLADRLGLVEIKPVVTYAGERVVSAAKDISTVVTSEFARPHPNTVLTQLNFRFNEDVVAYLSSTKNFSDRDASFGLGFDYSANDSLSFSLQSLFLNGPQNTQFGRWADNDFMTINVKYSF